MKIIEEVPVTVVRQHEETTDANARIDRYGLETLCPIVSAL